VARKQHKQPEPAEETTEEQTKEGGREFQRGEKTEILRQLWQEHPGAKNKDICRIFEEKTGETVSEVTASKARPPELRRTRGSGDQEGSRSGLHRVPTGEPTVSELMEVNKLAKNYDGGISELTEVVTKVEELARHVGGLDQLKKCLSAIAVLKGAD
jgi:hypothetical protein